MGIALIQFVYCKMKKRRNLFFLILLLSVAACQTDDPFLDEQIVEVENPRDLELSNITYNDGRSILGLNYPEFYGINSYSYDRYDVSKNGRIAIQKDEYEIILIDRNGGNDFIYIGLEMTEGIEWMDEDVISFIGNNQIYFYDTRTRSISETYKDFPIIENSDHPYSYRRTILSYSYSSEGDLVYIVYGTFGELIVTKERGSTAPKYVDGHESLQPLYVKFSNHKEDLIIGYDSEADYPLFLSEIWLYNELNSSPVRKLNAANMNLDRVYFISPVYRSDLNFIVMGADARGARLRENIAGVVAYDLEKDLFKVYGSIGRVSVKQLNWEQ